MQIYLIDGVRTAIGSFMGTLAAIPAPKLGAAVIADLLKRTAISNNAIDEVIMGNVISAGVGQCPARQAAIFGGIPHEVSALTINKVCGSGLKAVALATQVIKCGDASVIIAGGMESMSNTPCTVDNYRTGVKMGGGKITDLMVHDGLWCPFNDHHMGLAAEYIVEKYNISREEQDQYGANSHKKAVAAIKENKFSDEIIPLSVPQHKKDPITFDKDESPREDSTIEKLAKLKPVFKKDGTITPGNASSINDGAACVLVANEEAVKKFGLKPKARVIAYASGAVDPKDVMIAPVRAVNRVLENAKKKIGDVDLIELNEAFAAQCIAVMRDLKIDPEKVNVNGGAIALGHPIGASGTRILVTLLYEMIKRKDKLGLATLCLGGGDAVAMLIERV